MVLAYVSYVAYDDNSTQTVVCVLFLHQSRNYTLNREQHSKIYCVHPPQLCPHRHSVPTVTVPIPTPCPRPRYYCPNPPIDF